METTYKLNGKIVNKVDIPSDAKLKDYIKEKYYETADYTEQQNKKSMAFYNDLRIQREESEKYHG